jgi:UDP-N-acetylglucosamine 2-epimerase (non-hydrolysing)
VLSHPAPTFTVHLIAGARPNFMKVAPLFHVLSRRAWCTPVIVHTGQHYDPNMSDRFFEDLRLPAPHFYLGVGSGSHAEQTAAVMVAYEKICLENRPDWIVVVGDVNSTLACALVGAKLLLPVAHLEAGLRSRDRTMPEEINRLVTDAIADMLWAPSPDAVENLLAEGVPPDRIEFVGNIMIDSYEMLRPAIEQASLRAKLGLGGRFVVVTLHRPANVDGVAELSALVEAILHVAQAADVVFPVHPRTRNRLERFGLWSTLQAAPTIRLLEPLGYIEFLGLVREASLVVTDSGGLQEETTYLHIPCITVRDTTERPITVSEGSNRLARPEEVRELADQALTGRWPTGRCPERWDGHTADRIADSLFRIARAAREA